MKKINLIFLVIISIIFLNNVILSQPFTKKYVMSFFTCDTSCNSILEHMVNLAESDDGSNWTLVPNFVPYAGSVPDVIMRGNKLYIYTPGYVKRYDNSANKWDTSTAQVSIVDSNSNTVNFVDPSAFVDSSGKLVLFFLNSTGLSGDPAGCQTYPCDKYFDSAVEVDGSDGTQFILQSGHRTSFNLTNNQKAADPDIFFDGTNYYMYTAFNGKVWVSKSSTLHGSFSQISNLTNSILTEEGSVPCGFYDNVNNQYWTFVHQPENGTKYIKRAVHTDFSSQLTSFSIVLSGKIIGTDSLTTTESPGITLNTFLLTDVKIVDSKIPSEFSLLQNYPNPFNPSTKISYQLSAFSKVSLKVYDILGREIVTLVNKEQPAGNYKVNFDAGKLSSGVYFYRIIAGDFIQVKKMVLLK